MTEPQRPPEPAVPPVWQPTSQPTAEEPPAAAPAWPAPTAPVPASPPLESVIAKPKGSSGRGTTLLFVLAGAIAVGGIAFAAGRLSAPASAASAGRGFGQLQPGANGYDQVPGGGQGFPGRLDGGLGGLTVKGTVSAVSADSITVRLGSGTEVTIPLDATTTYHSSTTSSAAAVSVGSEVAVTPGARTATGAAPDPNAVPNASGNPGDFVGRMSFGPASDVTVIEK